MLLIMGFRKGEGMLQPPSSGAPSAEEFMAYQQELGQATTTWSGAIWWTRPSGSPVSSAG
jgi:hypothetical protein